MERRNISGGRQSAYYLGTILMIIGFVSFISVFVSVALGIASVTSSGSIDGDSFGAMAASFGIRAVGGMILIIIGGGLKNVGVRGLAGSGVILDPEQAREDIEPWARMTGGIVKDAADEAGLHLDRLTPNADDPDLPFDEKLRRLHKLREEGILSEEEYQHEKSKILENS